MDAVCESVEHARFLNVWPLMTDDDGSIRVEYYQPDGVILTAYDGLHMGAAGYDLWTPELTLLLAELL